MVKTVMIHGSDEVLAPLASYGTFYRGKWENIRVIGVIDDENDALEVRKSLVGLIVPTIFTKERIEEQTRASFPIPEGSRLAYSSDVIDVLKSAGKNSAAKQLEEIIPNAFDMYVFEKGIYELVN